MPQEPEMTRTLKEMQRVLEQVLTNSVIIKEQGLKMLQGEQDLQKAVTTLVGFAQTVATELTALQAAQGDPDADMESLSAQVTQSMATIQAAMPAAIVAPTGPTGIAAPTGPTGVAPTGSTGS